jgi:uncharacterized protein YkwD
MTRQIQMKSLVGKLLILALLVATAVTFYPRLKPVVDQTLFARQVHQVKPVTPPPGITYLAKVEDLVFEMTNQVRRARGLAPLVRDAELVNAARSFSNDMLVHRFFDHDTPGGLTFEKRLANQYPHWVSDMGENIWSGSDYDPGKTQEIAKDIMSDLMNSPGHRENILDPSFTHLGVGVSAMHHTIRATQEFVGRFKLWPLNI